MGNFRTIRAVGHKFFQLVSVLCASSGLFACASVNYVDNQDLKNLYGADPQVAGMSENGKRFGALLFKGNAEDPSDDRFVVLKKHSNVYAAETLVYDNTSHEVRRFERAYLSLGANQKKRFLGLQLRFEY